jgi:hypothetical protein
MEHTHVVLFGNPEQQTLPENVLAQGREALIEKEVKDRQSVVVTSMIEE